MAYLPEATPPERTHVAPITVLTALGARIELALPRPGQPGSRGSGRPLCVGDIKTLIHKEHDGPEPDSMRLILDGAAEPLEDESVLGSAGIVGGCVLHMVSPQAICRCL